MSFGYKELLIFFIIEDGVIIIDEQHIIQNTIARKRYPDPENELELDLLLTSLSD